MKSIVAALALLLAAGSYAGASERAVSRDADPAAVIAQFSQAIPPEPPVTGELKGHHGAGAAGCCRMTAGTGQTTAQPASAPCGCCRNATPATNAKGR